MTADTDAAILAIPHVLRVRRHGPTTTRILIAPEAPGDTLFQIAKQAIIAGENVASLLVHRDPGELPDGYKLVEQEDCDGEDADAAGVGGCLPTRYWSTWHWEHVEEDSAGPSRTEKARAIDDAWDDATSPWRLLADRIVQRLASFVDTDQDRRYLLLDLFCEPETVALVRHAAGGPEVKDAGLPLTFEARFNGGRGGASITINGCSRFVEGTRAAHLANALAPGRHTAMDLLDKAIAIIEQNPDAPPQPGQDLHVLVRRARAALGPTTTAKKALAAAGGQP